MIVNKSQKLSILVAVVGYTMTASFTASAKSNSIDIEFLRSPNGGVQPRAAVDSSGTIHLLYFRTKGSGGNLFYVSRKSGSRDWSSPLRVNEEDGGALRNGTIGLAQIALGKQQRIHVTWFDMRGEKYWYTRLNDDKTAFEPQRKIVERYHRGVEASAALAADGNGRVYVVWHAGDLANESRRGIYLRISDDEGSTFGSETRIDSRESGACGCCGLGAAVDKDSTLYVSYRSAGGGMHRDMTLLKSSDAGQQFSEETIDTWELGSCPVTITTISPRPDAGVIIAWENKEKSFFADARQLTNPIPVGTPPMSGRQKSPVTATSKAGATLVVWAEGKGWGMGGRLHWQLFDAEGEPTKESGQGVVDLSRMTLPEVLAMPDGRFTILY